MPNRMLRMRALTSRRLGKVSPSAEALYYRLMLLADDFGRYWAEPRIVQSHAYPLGERKTTRPFRELVSAGLVHEYESDGERYLVFDRWDQQVRAKDSRYPQPPTDVGKRSQAQTDVPLDVDGVEDVDGDEGGDVSKGASAPNEHQTYLLGQIAEHYLGKDGQLTLAAVSQLNGKYGRPVVSTAMRRMREEEPEVKRSVYALLERICQEVT